MIFPNKTLSISFTSRQEARIYKMWALAAGHKLVVMKATENGTFLVNYIPSN